VLSFRLIASLAAAGLVAATSLAISRVNERHLQSTLEREAESQLLLEARNLAMLSRDALLSEFPELTLVPLTGDIKGDRPEIRTVVILDHQGQIQGAPDPRVVGNRFAFPTDMRSLADAPPLRMNEVLQASEELILARAPVAHQNEGTLGEVVLTLDRSFIADRILEARRQSVQMALVLLAGSMLVAGILMSILFQPIGALKAGLTRIGRGDLDSPMRISDLTELGALGETVNEMATQLKASRALAKAREEEIVATQKEVITTLGDVVESRSSETANHTRRVGAMCRELASLVGMDDERADLLWLASPMHDVGKIGIPDSILNKPGALTDDEYEMMKSHTIIGHTLMSKSERPILKAAAVIAHQHHERWDGKGYPRGLAGEDIHIYGRITSLVDVFDALFSDRVYRRAMKLEKVLEIIKEGRGTQFEPRLVDLFTTQLNRFLAIFERYQDHFQYDEPKNAEAGPAESEPASAEQEPETVGS